MDLAMMIILTAENRPRFKIVMVEILAAFPLARDPAHVLHRYNPHGEKN
jgi:hypothetical protein